MVACTLPALSEPAHVMAHPYEMTLLSAVTQGVGRGEHVT